MKEEEEDKSNVLWNFYLMLSFNLKRNLISLTQYIVICLFVLKREL